MKLAHSLLLICSLLSAEDWTLIRGARPGPLWFVDSDVESLVLDNHQIVKIRMKVEFNGKLGMVIQTSYWRANGKRLELAVKHTITFNQDGSIRNESIVPDADLRWIWPTAPLDEHLIEAIKKGTQLGISTK